MPEVVSTAAVELQAWAASLGLVNAVLLLTSLALCAFSASGLLVIDRREALEGRIDSLRLATTERAKVAVPTRRFALTVMRDLGHWVAASAAVGENEAAKMARALGKAGLRDRQALPTFVGSKVLLLAAALILLWVYLEVEHLLLDPALARVPVLVGAGVLGWRLPDMLVGYLGRRRTEKIENAMPDALDLLIICAEAGIGLEQGLAQISRELASAHPQVAEELATTVAEMRVLSDRREALENFADRVNLPAIRSLVSTLVQTIKYGTPLAQSLRVLSAEMRMTRMAKFEERANRLPVLLTMPMLAFIMPPLFIVLVGPAILRIIDSFSKF